MQRDIDDLILLWKSSYVKKKTRVETFKLFLFFKQHVLKNNNTNQDKLLKLLKDTKKLLQKQMTIHYITVQIKNDIISMLSQLKNECGGELTEEEYRDHKNHEKEKHDKEERNKVRKVYSDFVCGYGLFPFVKEILFDCVDNSAVSILCDNRKKKIKFYTNENIIEFEQKLLTRIQDSDLNWQLHDFEYILSPQNSPLKGVTEEAARSEIHSCGNLFALSSENCSTPLGTLGHFVVLQNNSDEYEEDELICAALTCGHVWNGISSSTNPNIQTK